MSDSPRLSRKYDTRLNLRHAGQLFGRKRISAMPVLDTTGAPADGIGAPVVEAGEQLTELASRSTVIEDAGPYVENRDIWRVRIPRVGRTAFERFIKAWKDRRAYAAKLLNNEIPLQARIGMLRAGRELTAIELNDLREEEDQRRLEAFHREQASRGSRRIVDTLTRLKHCYVVEREGSRIIKAQVQIAYIEVCPLYYRYYVDARTLPYSVSIMDIQGDAVCTDLSVSCGHPVRSEIKQNGNEIVGLRYTIEIAATLGVPNQCKFSDLLPLMPTSAPSLAFITGYAEGKHLRWANLENMPHLLGGGQTMGGKSNMVHNILCCFIARNTPDQLRLALMDMKFDSGIELRRYRELPHLIDKQEIFDLAGREDDVPLSENVATTPAEAVQVLRYLMKIANQRGKKYAKQDVQNIRKWNRRHPTRKDSYIVAVIDELSNLRTDPEFGDEAYTLLNKILSTSRAAGISLVVFTQSSNKVVLNEFIKVNLPGRICFSMADPASSILFVNDAAATNLTPAGRAIFKHGTDKYLVQTPLIEPMDILDVINNAMNGKLTTHLASRPVLPEEVIAWSVEYNNSNVGVRDCFMHFGSELQRIEFATMNSLLREMEGKDYRVGDRVYQVLPSPGGTRPRIVALIDEANASPVEPESYNTTQNASELCPHCGAPREMDPCEWCRRMK